MVGALLLPTIALFALLASPTFALLSLAPLLILAIVWRLRPDFGPSALDWLINDDIEREIIEDVAVEEEEDSESLKESRRRLDEWDTKFGRSSK